MYKKRATNPSWLIWFAGVYVVVPVHQILDSAVDSPLIKNSSNSVPLFPCGCFGATGF